MSTDEQLTELLRTASGVFDDDLHADPRALISRARRGRRRRRMVGLCALVAVVFVVAAVTVPRTLVRDEDVDVAVGPANSEPEPAWAQPPEPGWTRLPDPPLSPRIRATAIATGDEVVVVGGSKLLCASGAACALDSDPTLADGAAFNLRTRTWRSIASAPIPFDTQRAIVVDGDVYLLTPCLGPRTCEEQLVLLRYRPAENTWDSLPPPPTGRNYSLTRFGTGLIAYDSSDDLRERTDWRLDLASGVWTKLPADPLPRSAGPLPPLVISRVMVATDADLLLFARENVGRTAASTRMIGARLNVESGTWSELPPAPGTGFEESVLDGVAVSGSSTRAPGVQASVPEGGIFDPAAGAWRPLPSEGWHRPPAMTQATAWRSGVVGVLRSSTAEYRYAGGSVLDVDAQTWIELPPVDDRVETSVTSVGRRLFLVGGARPGQLLNDAWVWTPPSATAVTGEVTAPSPAGPTALPQPTAPATTPNSTP